MSIASACQELERELSDLEERRARLQVAIRALRSLDGSPPAAGGNGARTRTPRGETRQRILEHLRDHPEDRGTAIAAALGLSRGHVNNALVTLKRTGRLRLEGRKLLVLEQPDSSGHDF